MKANTILRHCLAVLLILTLLLTVSAPMSAVPVSAATKATTLSGVPDKINKRLNEEVKFTVTVTPARSKRPVQLQRYNSETKKWETIHSYNIEGLKSAAVNMTIEEKYRQKTTGKWRVNVPGTKTAKAVTSKAFTVTTRNIDPPKLTAKSACIYCVETGQCIYTKNATTKRAQASTTKLMTAILTVESGKLNGTTKITKNAAKTPWGSYHMIAGDTYRNSDLLYAMMLPSYNDAATALAEGIAGSESAFVSMMNSKAKKMGLTNTQFKNAHGLDADGHYSTAVDLAKLTAYAYKIPQITKTWTTSTKTIRSLTKKKKWTLWSTDAILGYDKNFKGGKTGTEDNAKCCFAGVYTYEGKTYVTVVLGSNYGWARWTDTKKLHSYIKKHAAEAY
ncbi:MAG: D-alanyl-D-alanine carboxypeptidase [Mogibacterium sp.]|nr:D-alanyl-D-alanine carboxypeptidase [Mogibacterium sp.]